MFPSFSLVRYNTGPKLRKFSVAAHKRGQPKAHVFEVEAFNQEQALAMVRREGYTMCMVL
jgi:hypothetical protein